MKTKPKQAKKPGQSRRVRTPMTTHTGAPGPSHTIQSASTEVREIRRLYDGIVGNAKRTLESAIKIGELLKGRKAQTPHGQWLAWCDQQLPFDARTAERYMALFDKRDAIKFDNVSNLSHAMKLISAPSNRPKGTAAKPKRSKKSNTGASPVKSKDSAVSAGNESADVSTSDGDAVHEYSTGDATGEQRGMDQYPPSNLDAGEQRGANSEDVNRASACHAQLPTISNPEALIAFLCAALMDDFVDREKELATGIWVTMTQRALEPMKKLGAWSTKSDRPDLVQALQLCHSLMPEDADVLALHQLVRARSGSNVINVSG